jgi:hypothetical protein
MIFNVLADQRRLKANFRRFVFCVYLLLICENLRETSVQRRIKFSNYDASLSNLFVNNILNTYC